MLRWIIESSLRFRLLVVTAAAALLGLGFVQLRTMPADILPEFTPTQVEVQTEALGLSAEEVEQLITVPLEQDLLVGVPFLAEIESASLPGLSSVLMTFEPGTDLLDARQVVQERLTQAVGAAGLPEVAKPPQMIQPVSSNRRVSMIALSSETLSPIDVSVLARWVISPRLMGAPGVANVTVWGFRDRQLQVLVDPQRLQQSNTTLAQVIETAGNALEVSPLTFLEASTPGTGGFIDTANQRLNIFHEQTITTAAELAQVPLEGAAGQETTLGDVTTVVEDSQPLIGDAVCAGTAQCLILVVEKFPDANTVEVTEGVDDALAAMRPGLGDLRIDSSYYRPASFIASSFERLGWTLLAGALLLLAVIGLVYQDLRRSLITGAAIAVSLAAAVVVLWILDTTLNLMVLAGLVLALTALIHDAVVDPHIVVRRISESRRRMPAKPAWATIVGATAASRRAVLYAFLITVALAIPLLFLWDEPGAFLPSIVLSYLLATSTSMLIALTVTPVLSLLLLVNAPLRRREFGWFSWLRRSYDATAPRLVGRTGAASAVAGAIAAVGLLAVPFLETSMRPELNERDVLVHVEAPAGTSLPKIREVTERAVADLGSLPGVVNVGGQVGRAVMSDQIVNVNSGEVWVKVDPAADYERAVAEIEDTVRGYPDVSTEVLTYSEERIVDLLGSSDDVMAVRIYGEDPAVLEEKADEIQRLLADVDGVTQVNVERTLEEPTVRVEVDLARAQEAGVKPGDVRRAAATLLGGITVGNLFDQQKVFDVVVWGAPEIRRSATDIEELLVDTPDGGHVRIGAVADVQIAPNPAVIRHESVSPYLDVTAEVSGRQLGAVAADIEGLLDRVEFPLEHHAELLGSYQQRNDNLVRLAGVAVTAVIAVFLLLQAAFRSWRLALLSFAALPLAAVGGVVAVSLTDGTVTLGSIAGFIGVAGFAARVVVMLIRRFQELQREDGMLFGRELVIRGTKQCVAPTLTAAVGIAVILVPIVVAGSGSGLEIVHPMAVVIIGGLITTLVVNLFVVPVLYLRYGFFPDREDWAEDLFAPERTSTRASALAFAILPPVLLTACGGAVVDTYTIEHEPAAVESIAGTDQPRITMERQAAERLQIATTAVQESETGLTVPSSAIFVDPAGAWWVYTNPEPLVFVRHEIDLEREQDGTAYLSSGPKPGTQIVIVGVPELYGIEDAVAH